MIKRTISIAFDGSYGERFEKNAYLPMINYLGESICRCYGIGFPRGHEYTNEPLNKLVLTKIPTRMRRMIFNKYCSIKKYPDYYPYWWQGKLFDSFVANKMKNDKSYAFLTKSNMVQTIKTAKFMGKKIIILASSSEPMRQYDRYHDECKEFGITSNSIYGDEKFRDECNFGYMQADRIITISDVSTTTYLKGGYSPDILHLVPLTGTNFKIKAQGSSNRGKKAFISTAVHSMIKGTHRLLNSWKIAGIQSIPLVIVGSLSNDLKEYISKYGPYQNVIFAGFQNDLDSYYRQYDAVGILMSLSEGAGRTTPELMSHGFPMIVSPDATCDLIMDGVNGYIIDYRNEEALAERLRWFAEDWRRVWNMREIVLDTVKNRNLKDFGQDMGKYLEYLLEII